MDTASQAGVPAAHREAEAPGVLRERVLAARSVQELGDTVVDWVGSLGFPLPSIYLEVGGRLRGLAMRGYWQALEGFTVERGVIAETFRTGETRFVPDVRDDPRYIAAVPGVVAELCLPIRQAERVVGVLNVEAHVTLSPADVRIVTDVVAAFERRLGQLGGPDPESSWQRLARRSAELAALADPSDIGRFAVEVAREVTGLDSAVLVLEERGQLRVRAHGGPLGDELRALSSEALGDVASWTASATSTYTVGAIEGSGFAGHEALRRAGVEALASASLQSNGGRHGFLLAAGSQPCNVGRSQVQHLEVVAAHTASALYTALALEALRDRAAQDPLTGLGHGATFHEDLGRALEGPVATAVLLIDLDNFKQINDTLGHVVGDRVLLECSRILEGELRGSDRLYRVGGDEFAAILSVRDAEEAVAIARRLNRAARRDGRARVSIGVAMLEPPLVETDTALARADLALYEAKRLGRDGVALYRPALRTDALDRSNLAADLALAVERDELFLAYQPVVDLAGEGVLGVEVLVRWAHPQRGVLGPAEFIPLAEQYGHIEDLSRWVLDAACRQVATWCAQPWARDDLRFGVNISAAELGPGLVTDIAEVLERYGLPSDRLIVEVTESLFMDELGAAPPLRALRELGVNVAIDDFGTGYSSLSYLRRLPVNILKIDRSFVEELDDPRGAAVTRAIIELSRTLGLSTVAEGVEDRSQAARLRSLGCEHAQGFLWSRPVEAAAFPAVVRRLDAALRRSVIYQDGAA